MRVFFDAVNAVPARTSLTVCVMVGYTAIAWAVGSFYPFSVFPMYATEPGRDRAGRLGARLSSGEIVEVTTFRGYDCEEEVLPARFEEQCELGPVYAPGYLDDELSHYVRTRPISASEPVEPVEIVRRVWILAPDGATTTTDCVLTRCGAAR